MHVTAASPDRAPCEQRRGAAVSERDNPMDEMGGKVVEARVAGAVFRGGIFPPLRMAGRRSATGASQQDDARGVNTELVV